MDAHLVLQCTAGDGIARAEATVRIRNELGHDEEGNALGAGRRVGQAGEYQVDDVLRHVVLAGGNEDLATCDLVRTIGLG